METVITFASDLSDFPGEIRIVTHDGALFATPHEGEHYDVVEGPDGNVAVEFHSSTPSI